LIIKIIQKQATSNEKYDTTKNIIQKYFLKNKRYNNIKINHTIGDSCYLTARHVMFVFKRRGKRERRGCISDAVDIAVVESFRSTYLWISSTV